MTSARLCILICCLLTGAGISCATDPAAPAPAATRSVEQSVLDRDLCAEWAACYAGCAGCRDDDSCLEQALERADCDTQYDPAPEFCPYPG